MTANDAAARAGRLAIWAALAACLSTSMGGSSFVAMRFLVTETDPVTIAFLRNAGAALVLTPLAFAMVRRWPGPRELVVIGIMGAAFFGGLQFLFANALTFTTSGRAALTYMTTPFMTLALAALFRAEPTTRFKVAGVVLATAGVVVALWQSSSTAPPNAWIGDLLVLFGALISAVFNVWSSRWLRLHEPLVVAVTGVLPGTLLLFIVAQALGAPTVSPELSSTGWLAVGFLGLFGAAISYMLWLWALRHTTPTLVAVSLPMNPLMALLWGAVLLGEPVTRPMVIGFALVIVGIALSNWRPRRSPARN
ncbi:MAG: EamA family transporter [Alphaproteobacteria bacterium]|nr:EamA family transporter [Alphaproteobacteria bacterium]